MRPKKHRDDEIRRSVPRAAGPDHQPEERAGAARRARSIGTLIDGEIAPLYSDKGRPGIPTRFVIGLLLLKQITGCPMRACASAGSMTRTSSTSPAKSFSSMLPARALRPQPLAQAARRQAGAAAGRELAGGACQRGAAQPGPQAGHDRHHSAAQEYHLPDRRQAPARRHQRASTAWPASTRCDCGNPICASPNARR